MKDRDNVKIEIFLVVLIALCMLALINVSNSKVNEILSSNNSILLRENPDNQVEKILAKEMSVYKTEACTTMETFDSNFNLIGRIDFIDHHHSHHTPDIKKYPDLQELFKKYPEGHARIQIDDNEEDIYFRWIDTDSGRHVICVVYIARPIVKNLWIIQFLCYLILILIFILVVRLHMSRQRDSINFYHKTSMRVHSRIFNKNE